jgi:PAS domain S-box-containing protein
MKGRENNNCEGSLKKSTVSGWVSSFRILKKGIFFRTFTLLITLSLVTIILFAVLIIPQEQTALLKSIESQAIILSASIAEVSGNSFLTGDYSLIIDHNMQMMKSGPDILYIIIVRNDGLSLVHSAQKWEQRNTPDPEWNDHLATQKGGILYSKLVNKKVYNYSFPLRLSGVNWGTLHLGLSLSQYEEQLSAIYRVIALLCILCFVITIIIAYFFARRLTSPILYLQKVTQKITDGDLAARAHIATGDEVESLAASFNKMTDTMTESQYKMMAAYSELEVYHKNLETLVRQRTVQLTEINKKLEQELSERLRAENALMESEYRYRTIFETTGNATMISETNNTIFMVNTAFETLSGYTRVEIEGKKSWEEFFPCEVLDKLKEYFACQWTNETSVKGYGTHFIDREGNIRDVYLSSAIIPGTSRTAVSFLDLTDLKRLEAQLLQAQKMDAIGQLAGGVAHDFNNILTAIIGYGNLLDLKITEDSVEKGYIEQINASAKRATNLTQGLLAFSRKQVITPKPIDLNDTIKNVEKLLIRLIGEDIELKTTYMDKNITVFADSGQIEQILINLATNARDAMVDGGLLSISTEIITLDKKTADQHGAEKPGRYVLISVSDTGKGMDKKLVEHIFEPFFTTKEKGKGTGLGLSIVYGIIKQHDGYINAYSEPGEGTTFKMYLPLITSPAYKEEAPVQKIPIGGNETILIAEDDEFIRALAREVLESYGYTIIEASDGEEALTQFEAHKEQISLLILDVIMPKKNGKIVYENVKAMRPDVKTLFVSGYTADIIHKKGFFEKDLNFLGKPIVPIELALKVREVLDSPK